MFLDEVQEPDFIYELKLKTQALLTQVFLMTTDRDENQENQGNQDDINANNGNSGTPSFFEGFTQEQILAFWNECNTLLELAHKLGFTGTELSRLDYEYIEKFKTREVWNGIIKDNRKKERERPAEFKKLSASDLQAVLDSPGIETVTHVGTHFLMSGKHARKLVKEQISTLRLSVKPSLHWGIYGISATPPHWPTSQYVKRKGAKPMTCPRCYYQAVNPQQMEIHHPHNILKGPKAQRTSQYFQSPNVIVLCRNCHSLEHRTGDHLQRTCGAWRTKRPSNLLYNPPGKIFNRNCKETYTTQKRYFLKWHLRSPSDYRCQICGVARWGPQNFLLVLELHHKDRSHKNSSLSNLRLVCPNCHRL